MAGNTAGSIIIDIVAKTGELQTDVDRAQSSIHKLQRELQKFQKETAVAGNEFKRNFIGPLREGENPLKSFNESLGRASQGFTNLGRGMQQNQGSFRNANQIIQNTSYQVTDFVVQVQGGVSAMRAFSQQAPQFLGAFGPMGAMLGVFAALGGAFAPMVIEAVKGAGALKSFDDALKASEAALGSVMSVGRSFDMTPVIKQFNDADAVTRQSIIQLMNYKKALIDVTNIDLRKAFTSQVADLTDTGFFSQFSDAMPSEQFAKTMGIAVNKQMYADLRVLRYEYGSVQEFADKYASTLARGNEEARKFATTIIEMARSLKEGEMATKAIDAAQKKMVGAGATGIIPTDKSTKAVKEMLSPMENWRKSVSFAINDATLLTEKIQEMARMIETAVADGVEASDPAFKAMIAQYDQVANAYTKLMQGPKELKEKMSDEMKMMNQITSNFSQQFSNTIVDGVMKGKLAFADFANSVVSMILKIMLNRAVISFLNAFLPGGTSGGEVVGPDVSPNAKGNAFSNGMLPFAKGGAFTNSIVNGATPFAFGGAFGGRLGVMGEAGPEAIVPLKRSASGELGVRSTPSNVSIVVNNNSSNAQATATSTTDSFGNRQIEILVADMVNKAIATGKTDSAMRSAYNIRRSGK